MANSEGTQAPVLVIGATGNVGRLVVEQLLDREVPVRVIVRSPDKFPQHVSEHPNLSITQGTLLDMSDDAFTDQVRGCGAVISCLGHVINFQGMYGKPRYLCRDAAKKVCDAIERTQTPGKFVLLNTVGTSNPAGDRPRGFLEKVVLGALAALLPPVRDNNAAASFLSKTVGTNKKFFKWVSVRPDGFVDGAVSRYSLHPRLINSLFDAKQTTKANIAHFMCELVTNPETWKAWEGQMPVIVNEEQE
mmetsp:Transcript_11362/g.14170  ORF Transcript_11362/g.14170 Transcript_11362/m.14170 type:complete len:247 (+) Transcript_11362:123-863(+)